MPYYIAEIGGFDHSETAPEGAVFVSDEDFQALFAGQREGASIIANKQGYPVLRAAPALTLAEQSVIALKRRDDLLLMAALRIAPLQDAVDVERATATEVNALKTWKNYRIDLDRIDQQEGFPASIQWPQEPGTTS